MAKSKNNTIQVEKKLDYSNECDTYTVQLKKRKKLWWLFLLLLPLLLLIQCHKDIAVTCVDADGGCPVAGQEVTMSYNAHFLVKDFRFFVSDPVVMTQTTNDDGKTVFENLPYSVFSYIFYSWIEVTFTAESECHHAAHTAVLFHPTPSVKLKMQPLREDLHVMLLDLETGDLLPGGLLEYTYEENGVEKRDSIRAGADGVAVIPQMRLCGDMKLLKGSCYGYADTVKTEVSCRRLVVSNPDEALRLRPLKARFTFFVKSKTTRQPIPDAQCVVTLTHPRAGHPQTVRHVRTSIDGRGIAVYDEDAFVLSTLTIHASKLHYGDGDLEGGPWTVERFIRQSDSIRTVWLEPEPYLQEFYNVDSVTGKRIPGVENIIRVTNPDGTTAVDTVMSNRNGVFPVLAQEDAKVEIISDKEGYKVKRTKYPKFSEIRDEEKGIKMQPDMVTLQFRTLYAMDGSLLPNCQLTVRGSISGSLSLNNSGNGTFNVTMRKDELLSIVASKSGYATNRTKVKNASYVQLSTQSDRDIPLDKLLEAERKVSEDEMKRMIKNPSDPYSETICYDADSAPFTIEIVYHMCPACTTITLMDANGRNKKTIVPKEYDGTASYTSPTKRICVLVENRNKHEFRYKIRQKY